MSTRIQINQISTDLRDGWTPANEAWTYASASTITVPSGAASKYQKGDRIKFTQTTVKYAVIVTVADTLLTIAVNTDYTVADAAITANYYSHQANPLGYPHWFNYVPTLNTDSTDLSGYNVARFSVLGNLCNIYFIADNRTLSGSAGQIKISLPVLVNANATNTHAFYTVYYISGYIVIRASIVGNDSYVQLFKGMTADNWAANETGVYIRMTGSYEI